MLHIERSARNLSLIHISSDKTSSEAENRSLDAETEAMLREALSDCLSEARERLSSFLEIQRSDYSREMTQEMCIRDSITDEDLVINCVRDGEVPGIHAVMYDSDADMITICLLYTSRCV